MSTIKELQELAQTLFDDKKYSEVIALLTDEILDKEKNAELYTQRAWAHNRLTESEKALYYVNKALEYNPQDAKTYTAMGLAFDNKMDYTTAIKNYTEAIAIDPVSDIAFYDRGLALFHKGEYDLAIEDYNKAIHLNPRYAKAFNSRGIIWALKRKYDRAIKDCTRAIELDPQFALAFNNRGNIWAHKREFKKALLDYNVAIGLVPNFAPLYWNRGNILEAALNNYPKAINDYNKAIELDETNRNELIYRRDILLEKVKEQQQLQEITKPDDGVLVQELGKQLVDSVEAVLKLAIASQCETAVHYSTLTVADEILSSGNKSGTGKHGKMRYYNAVYMSSHGEGRIIFDCFTGSNKDDIQAAFERGKRFLPMGICVGSFLNNNVDRLHEDEAAMWRAYGKDENKTAAAGCCFVVDSTFFDRPEDLSPMQHSANGQLLQEGSISPQVLYKVIYYRAGKYWNDENGDIKKAMAGLENVLKKLIAVRQACDKEKDKRVIDGFIFKYVSHVSYLFKSADYASEQELRVIQYVASGTELLRKDKKSYPPKLYIQSNKSLLPHLKKIWIGPRVENADHWMTYLMVQRCNPENPDKKDYTIEIQKSSCTADEIIVKDERHSDIQVTETQGSQRP